MCSRRRIRPKSSVPVIALLLVFFFLPLFPPVASAAPEKDYVIVIDVSTSMQDVFDEVKRLTKQTISQAKPGDNVAIITFGERATLLDRRMVKGKADIEALQTEVDALYPTDYATYLNSGMEKSIGELRYLFEKNPDRERVLLWLSDDKDNPPTQLAEGYISLDKLRERNERFEPGREWFAYKAPLSEVKNAPLEDFITWARRTTFRVGVKENDINLGSFENENVHKKVVITFEPQHPGAAGLEFFTGASLVDPKDPTRTIPVTLTPNRVVAANHTWQQQFDVSFTGEPGEYKGEIAFQSVSGPLLEVVPRKVILTAMIAPPKPVEEEPPAEVEEKPQPKGGLLADAKEKGIIATESRPPGTTRPAKPFTFGPLEPGKKEVHFFDLYLNREADTAKISQDLAIDLPEGVNIASKIFGKGGKKLTAEVTVSVDDDAALPDDYFIQGGYEGSIHFVSDESGVEILPLAYPIRIEMNADKVRWGTKILPTTTKSIGASRARRMTFEELTRELEEDKQQKPNPIISAVRSVFAKVGSRYVLLPFAAVVLLLFILMLYRMRPASELFVGELVIIKDPTDSKTKNINLKRIGSLHGKDTLTLGSSASADIRLDHSSVAPIHCRISAKRSENQIEVSILPGKTSLLKINDVECAVKTRLSDKDLLGIGEFILLFSNPEPQKEVVVHFRDGRTMRGTPVTWDIGAPSFELLRTDVEGAEGTMDEITLIQFDALKGIFFLKDVAEAASPIPRQRIKHNELLEITFFDGEKIEGNPLVDYSSLSARFYLVPKDMPNIVSILIERASIKGMTKREVKGEPEAAAGRWSLFKSRRKEASAD
jgi:hypothetical protein